MCGFVRKRNLDSLSGEDVKVKSSSERVYSVSKGENKRKIDKRETGEGCTTKKVGNG